jgi:hypothetical protein
MTVYSFDATASTHDLLKLGVTEARMYGSQHTHHRVVVAAEDRDTAALTAAQMVSCTHTMCTGLYDRI